MHLPLLLWGNRKPATPAVGHGLRFSLTAVKLQRKHSQTHMQNQVRHCNRSRPSTCTVCAVGVLTYVLCCYLQVDKLGGTFDKDEKWAMQVLTKGTFSDKIAC